MHMSYLTVQSHSDLKVWGGKSQQQQCPGATSPFAALAGTQKHPPAIQNNAFLPTFIVSLCVTWELTISGHRDTAYTRFAALYPITGATLPTLRQAHALSQWDTTTPPLQRGKSLERSKAAMEEQPLVG